MKRFLLYLGVTVAAIVVIALLLNVVMTLVVGGRQATVPDVRGLSQADARAVLKQNRLKMEVTGDKYSIEYPESTVAFQDPLGGREVKQGRKVMVQVSLGGEFQDMPYCVGKPFRTAGIIIERSGLVVGNVTRVASDAGYPEEVLATEPMPGSQVLRGRPVNILVNDGPPAVKVLMPDLRGKDYLPVKLGLERRGMLVLGSSFGAEFRPSRSHVVIQDPLPGHVISRGDTVHLVISESSGEGGTL
jgi:serine/threonine-protein kinase